MVFFFIFVNVEVIVLWVVLKVYLGKGCEFDGYILLGVLFCFSVYVFCIKMLYNLMIDNLIRLIIIFVDFFLVWWIVVLEKFD